MKNDSDRDVIVFLEALRLWSAGRSDPGFLRVPYGRRLRLNEYKPAWQRNSANHLLHALDCGNNQERFDQ